VAVRRFLAAVRRRLRRRNLALAGLIVANLGLLLVLLGLPGPLPAHAGLRPVYLGGSALVLLVALVRLARAGRAATDDGEIAAGLAAVLPRGDLPPDAVRSAVELAGESVGPHAPSPVLIGLHVEATARDLARVDAQTLVSFAPLARPARLLGLLALTLGVIVILVPQALPAFFRSLAAPPMAIASVDVAAESGGAVIGQIRLTYRHPAYSGLDDRVIEGATGDIRALRGTEVEIEAIVDRPVAAASLEIEPGETVPAALSDGHDLRASIVLDVDATWRATFVSENGRSVRDPMAHAIVVDEDRHPEVRLLQPAVDLEVDELAAIDVEWDAEDDFALDGANLVVVGSDGEHRQPLELGRDPRRAEGRTRWITERELEPGEELEFYVEVFDNDTVSGPKRSVSASRRVRIRSARDLHGELLAQVGRLLDEVLATLSEILTATGADPYNVRAVADTESAIGARFEAHVASLDGVLLGLWSDPLATEATYRTLADMRVRFDEMAAEKTSFLRREAPALRRPFGDAPLVSDLRRIRTEETDEVETNSLLLDDLVHRERLSELRELAEDLARDQDELIALLDEYRRTGDPETLAAVERLMARMERKLQELNAKMAGLGGSMVEEFVNLDALRRSLDPKGAGSLAELRELLQSGDLDAAMERASELLAGLGQSLRALESSARGAMSLDRQRMFAQATQITERLQALSAAEGELIESTDGVKREIENRRFGHGSDPSEFFDRQRERAEEIAAEARRGLTALDGDPAVTRRARTQARLEELTRDIHRRLRRGADIAELEASNREIFELRQELMDPAVRRQLQGRQALEQAVELADDAALALAGRSLADALDKALQLQARAREADRNLAAETLPAMMLQPATPDQSLDASDVASAVAGESARRAGDQTREMVKDLQALDNLLRRPLREDASKADESRLGELGRRQGTLESEAGEVVSLIGELSEEMPEIPAELAENVEQAGQYMGLAKHALDDSDVQTGISNERRAKELLDDAMRSMQEASQQCNGGGDAQSGGAGSAFAFVPSGAQGPPRFRDGRQEGGQQGERRGGPEGIRGHSGDEVEIPGEEHASAPEEFRRDVLEGMKEPRPPGYETAIDRYYRRLVQ